MGWGECLPLNARSDVTLFVLLVHDSSAPSIQFLSRRQCRCPGLPPSICGYIYPFADIYIYIYID